MKREEKREKALEEIEKAKEEGDVERVNTLSKRTTRVTKEVVEECKKLLRLMGIPVVEAKSEAEAQCAQLVKDGIAWATGSEDSDSLVFGTPILLKNLSTSDPKKKPILQIDLQKALEELQLSYDQFIDTCILLGCDFCPKIKGIGPKRALEFIKKYKTIEKILETLDKNKYTIPEPYRFEEARLFFKSPDVFPSSSFTTDQVAPNEEELLKFLVEKGFKEDRVKNNLEKLKKNLNTKFQTRITDYFKISPSTKKSPKNDVKSKPKKSTPKKSTPKKEETKPKVIKRKVEEIENNDSPPIIRKKSLDIENNESNPTKKRKLSNENNENLIEDKVDELEKYNDVDEIEEISDST